MDQFDERTEKLFDEWAGGIQTLRDLFSAELREKGKEIADLRAENERLKADLDVMGIDGMVMRLIAERDQLKALVACALASISGDETASWPQPHPELLTRCAAAFQTMRAMGSEINKLKEQIDDLRAELAKAKAERDEWKNRTAPEMKMLRDRLATDDRLNNPLSKEDWQSLSRVFNDNAAHRHDISFEQEVRINDALKRFIGRAPAQTRGSTLKGLEMALKEANNCEMACADSIRALIDAERAKERGDG